MYYTSDCYMITAPERTLGGWTVKVYTKDGMTVSILTYATKTGVMKARTRERKKRLEEGAKVIYI